MRMWWRCGAAVVVGLALLGLATCIDEGPNPTESPISPVATPAVEERGAAESVIVPGGVEIRWEDAAGTSVWAERAYVDEGSAPEWRGFVDVELRQAGAVLASQSVPVERGPAAGSPGTGTFATVTWEWDVGEMTGVVEEWVRLRWSADGEEDILGLMGPDQAGDARGFWMVREIEGGLRWVYYFPVVFCQAKEGIAWH